jgi:hypothetical protein
MNNIDEEIFKEITEFRNAILLKFKATLNEEIKKIPKVSPTEFIALMLSISGALTTMIMHALVHTVSFEEEEITKLIDYWVSETKALCLERFKETKD